MKYVYESLDEQKRIALDSVTWDAIEPIDDPMSKWTNDKVNLPNTIASYYVIRSREAFEDWYESFTDKWGVEGELVEIRPNHWEIKGNKKWDKIAEIEANSISSYYDNKGSGGYTGD
jgi:hypothetical protein